MKNTFKGLGKVTFIKKQNPFYCHLKFAFYYQRIMLLVKSQNTVLRLAVSPRADWKDKFLVPSSDLPNQKLWGWFLQSVFSQTLQEIWPSAKV